MCFCMSCYVFILVLVLLASCFYVISISCYMMHCEIQCIDLESHTDSYLVVLFCSVLFGFVLAMKTRMH